MAAPTQRPADVRRWSVTDVAEWMHSIELGEHAAAFTSNAVDGALSTLPPLHANIRTTLAMELCMQMFCAYATVSVLALCVGGCRACLQDLISYFKGNAISN